MNNELVPRNQTYIRNLFSLNRLVLYRFTRDQLVVPASSTWFGLSPATIAAANGSRLGDATPHWLGLGLLAESDRIDLRSIEGGHMEIPTGFVRDSLVPYLNNSYPGS